MRLNLFIINMLLGLLPAWATVPGEISGKVSDVSSGEPIAGVVVKSKGAFTSTDINGNFKISLKAGADSVSFRCIGYEVLTLPVSAGMESVKLTAKATQLKDVIVEAPDIYAKGDTLVFNVARYANAKDNAIIDVIKRLPGIKVEEDGTIKYQGKPINRFYIDGNDFMGGQYGLATNNISHEDVKSVEVMENHQPVKALEGIEFPEEAGINLKLKEDARSRWVGVAQAATGIGPWLYDGSLFTMRIAPKVQNMFTLKGDNTGWNPANEITEHDFNDMSVTPDGSTLWPEYIWADMINAPLSEKRTRDNLSGLANAITAWKSGDTSMRLKLNYMGDRLDYNSRIRTEYIGSGIPDFIQNNKLRTMKHDLSSQLNSETNKRGYFLKNRLTVNAVWDNSESNVSGSLDLTQRVGRKKFSAVNDTKLVKRNEKKVLTIVSRNAVEHRPDRLIVNGKGNAMQSVGSTDVRSTTEVKSGRLTRFWKFYLSSGADLNYHRMEMALTGLGGGFDNTGVYNNFLSDIYATPQVDYNRNGWKASLQAPLKWMHYSIKRQYDYINVVPRLNVRRQLTAKSELSGTVGYSLGSPQAYLNINNPILQDYHNIFIGHNSGRYTHRVDATLSYRYRNPLKSLFVNGTAGYGYQRQSLMSNQIFVDDMIVSTYTDNLSDTRTWNFNGDISKGLGRSKMVAGCSISASIAAASSMRNYEAIPYRMQNYGIKPYLRGSVVRWLSVNYEADYHYSNLIINRESNKTHTYKQNFSATVLPGDFIQLTIGADHFLTHFSEGNTANMVLLDASAVWKKNSRTRLSLTATNLLNRHGYEYVTYGALSRSEYWFGIRGRNIIASVQYRF